MTIAFLVLAGLGLAIAALDYLGAAFLPAPSVQWSGSGLKIGGLMMAIGLIGAVAMAFVG